MFLKNFHIFINKWALPQQRFPVQVTTLPDCDDITRFDGNLIMFTYNICKPDDKCRVNTDLPPLETGKHKIKNIEWVTTPNMWINNLHAIYMILCEMREWFDG